MILYLSTFQKKQTGLKLFSYGFFDFTASAELKQPKIDQKPLFHFKPSGIHFKETLFQTSTPCRVPPKELISWDFRPFYTSQGLETPGSFWPLLGESRMLKYRVYHQLGGFGNSAAWPA